MSDRIGPSSIFRKSDDVLDTAVDLKTILMSMDSGQFVELNPTAGATWGLIDGKRSIADIAQRLSQTFDVSADTCQPEVIDLLKSLTDAGLVHRQD